MLAFGLDPVVAALVARGWKRGRASLVVFAGLFASVFVARAGHGRTGVGRRSSSSSQAIPGYWDELTQAAASRTSSPPRTPTTTIRHALKDLAAGLPEAASALLGIAGGVFGSVLSLVTLTFLALFLLMERPTITDWLFGFTPPDDRAALAPGGRGLDPGDLLLADRQRRDLDRGRHRRRASAWALGLPFPLVLAVITGLLDLIPQIGATVAAVILVAVALTVGTTEAI